MLLRTPLYEKHLAYGARMVEFGGWEMPVQYSSLLDEHHAVRQSAGLFDISHMGRFVVSGPDAEAFLQHIATCDVSAIAVGQSNYGLLCRPDGGIVDDIFIYHLPNEFLVVVNASNRAKDWAWFHEHASGFTIQLDDRSDQWAMLALQGPAAETLLNQTEDVQADDLAYLPFHGVALCRLFGVEALIARTGYTGEDGFELFFAAEHAPALWDALLTIGVPGSVKPCGLGARDSLRFEPCLALYGHEISDTINPYEARLGWVVKLDKGDFVGRERLSAIKATGPARRLTGFEMVGKGIARGDYAVQSIEGDPIGHVTTGMPAPTLGKMLGMALVPTALSKEGSEFDIIVRDKPVRARAIKMPFYKARYKK
ncbi:glycine cleavage system aminomethyltransferase GcvT [Candidatus Gracilibacteria bacterium]|nr:glycine cleavage system aminomethyltransferase GcvT [Candidatus Gracilibacteria bacterium]